MPRVVVLGTGTSVGKTYVTAALARALAASDPAAVVCAVKPLETGVPRVSRDGAPHAGTDAALLEAASRGKPPRPHPLYAFREPLSVHVAARHQRARISLPAVSRWLSAIALPDTALRVTQWILIETAGGALSPVTNRLTNAHLATELDPAVWILVAPDSLGVFHDVRATLLGLVAAARAPDFLVLSGARAPDLATGCNAAEFSRLRLPRPAAVLDRHRDPEAALAPLVRELRRRFAAEP
jgi:dethiobiotin synthetase